MKRIGLSLSFCVKDIMNGKVKERDVEKIIAETSVKTEADWDVLIKQYQQSYWINNPIEGEAICRRLLKAGKIEQPLLEGKEAPDLSSGQHWINLSLKEKLKLTLDKMDFCLPSMLVGSILGASMFLLGFIQHFFPGTIGAIIFGLFAGAIILKVLMPILNAHDKKSCYGKFPVGMVGMFIALLFLSIHAFEWLGW